MATEQLHFKLQLYSTYWDKPPIAEIVVGGESVFNDEITSNEKNPTVIEFKKPCIEGQKYELVIKRSGKGKNQTRLDANGKIEKDQLLHIKQIEIDEIDIGALVYEGVYTPQYPQPWHSQQIEAGHPPEKTFKNVTAMGHNGTWTLAFESPFYMWLLENLY
tara:strand:+ start:303 stop:785 length:483 start_codon:yes stop_codon:yes gene_type:complete